MRNKYRLTFTKMGAVRFLGHLDLLNMFQRSIKRAGLPISYSNGFNPHQQMSFALPLPLGVEGLNEYIDIELDEKLETQTIINKLNEKLPDGIQITSTVLLFENEKSGAALVNKAIYLATLPINDTIKNSLDEIIAKILEADEITVTKKTKSGLSEVDIRQDIFDVKNKSDDENITIEMTLSAGSMKNLKADVVIEYIYKTLCIEYEPAAIKYVREKLILGAN